MGGQGANGYPQYLAPIETKTFFLKYPTSASASDPPQIFRPSAGPELSAGEAVIRTLQIRDHPYITSAKGLGGWGQKNGNFC